MNPECSYEELKNHMICMFDQVSKFGLMKQLSWIKQLEREKVVEFVEDGWNSWSY
jgi:hypothetical protein